MSFFDDLKKPVETPRSTIPTGYVFTDDERKIFVAKLCDEIRFKCASANKKGKRSVRGYCFWYYSELRDDYNIPYRIEEVWIKEDICDIGDATAKYCTQAERDLILSLARKNLAADGFPADVLRPYDCSYGNGIFNRKIIYFIELNVHW